MEPSPEAVQAMRERLRAFGFLLTDAAARDLLRSVLDIESARLDRRAREAAAACLHSIQNAAREALAILTEGPASITAPMPAVGAAAPKAPSASKPDQPVNLADVLRKRLGDDVSRDEPASRPEPRQAHAPPPPPPAPPAPPPAASHNRAPVEPRRPVFKRPRGR
jgi:hypothetical protein